MSFVARISLRSFNLKLRLASLVAQTRPVSLRCIAHISLRLLSSARQLRLRIGTQGQYPVSGAPSVALLVLLGRWRWRYHGCRLLCWALSAAPPRDAPRAAALSFSSDAEARPVPTVR